MAEDKGVSRMSANHVTSVLFSFISAQDWESTSERCKTHPLDTMYVDVRTGRTPLHVICATGSAPFSAVEAVVSAWPTAAFIQDRRGKDTPVHLQCRNSQRSNKVAILLKYGGSRLAELQNRHGQTPLHVACGYNAMIPVIQALLHASPGIIGTRDLEGSSPLNSLWRPYVETIPGHVAIARVLKGYQVDDKHFGRFWEKVLYLLEASMHKSDASGQLSDDNRPLLHDVVSKNVCPLNLLKVAVKLNPDVARATDCDGNTLLHVVVTQRSFDRKKDEAIWAILESCSEVASICNCKGRKPLNLAIETDVPWAGGLKDIMYAHPAVLGQRDPAALLFPFMLAASNGVSSLDSTFQLLTAQPDLVKLGIE